MSNTDTDATDALARALDNLLRHHNAGSAHAISRPLHECEFARSALAALEQAAEAADREACDHDWTASTSYQLSPFVPGSVCAKCGARPSAAADPEPTDG